MQELTSTWNDLFDVQALTTEALGYVPNILGAALVLFGTIVLTRLTSRPLRAVLERADFSPGLIKLLVGNVFKYVVLGIGIIMAAEQIGFDLSAALGTLGVAGIAVGLAARDSIANSIAGFLIFWDKPFRVGDYVTASDLYGRVETITLRTTRIRTRDNTYVIIPNQEVIDGALINHSMRGNVRLNIDVGIAYKESIAEAREVLLTAVRNVEAILEDPAPDVVVVELGDSSVNLRVRVWVDNAESERPVRWQCTELCKTALDEAGIEIPFPHLQLFVDGIKEEALAPLVADRSAARETPEVAA